MGLLLLWGNDHGDHRHYHHRAYKDVIHTERHQTEPNCSTKHYSRMTILFFFVTT